ncbi:MAG: UDP-N-acetylmuramate dehydrogenase [Phycisphaeraceae bacterium]
MGTDASIDAGAVLAAVRAMGVACEAGVPLGPLTWYGVGGCAEVLARPTDVAQLQAVARYCDGQGLPLRVMGKGANLLVADEGVDGVVVLLNSPAFQQIEIDGEAATVTAGGGANLERVITSTVREGLAGLETLAGIPATVGGAIRMNAGGSFGQIADTLETVTLMNGDGSLTEVAADELELSYRHSNIGERIVVEATFALKAVADRAALRDRLKQVMRYKKESQPMAAQSAGCAFKNPPSEVSDGRGAGKLIDEAGLKGLRIGGAEVSNRHANFIVTHEGAQANDILKVMNAVQQRVAEKFNIKLEREVVVWPPTPPTPPHLFPTVNNH